MNLSRRKLLQGAAVTLIAPVAVGLPAIAGVKSEHEVGPVLKGYEDLDYAWYLGADGKARIFENGGVLVQDIGPFAAGDEFEITYEAGGQIRYSVRRNGEPKGLPYRVVQLAAA